MGAEEFAQIRQELPRSTNVAYEHELQSVGQRIVAVSGSPIPPAEWDFVVFRSDQVNAFALPGGHVGAFEGMMVLVGGDDAELAAVVGHEVGHVIARHSAQRVGTEEITQLGIGAVAAALQLGGYADAQTASQLLGTGAQYGILLPFSRSQELEAEQTKTGLARWFLAFWLVTSSKGGISAMELQRQMGFASYQTAWSWLHKIRKAMVRPDRSPLADRVEADETLLGGAKPGKRGRGAAGKTVVAGAVESGRGKGRGRRLGRLRLQSLADASAASLQGFLDANTAKPVTVATDGWAGYRDLASRGYDHEPVNLSASWGDASLRLPGIHLVFGLAKRWLLGTHRRWIRRSDPAGNGLASARP